MFFFYFNRCVVKYLYDLYSQFSFNLLGFLVEVLEKGPSTIQSPVLTIIHCLLHYVDMTSATQTINSDLLRTVAKFVEVIIKVFRNFIESDNRLARAIVWSFTMCMFKILVATLERSIENIETCRDTKLNSCSSSIKWGYFLSLGDSIWRSFSRSRFIFFSN